MAKIICTSLCIVMALQAYCHNPVKHEVDSLYDLAWEYRVANPDSAIYFANRQLKLAKEGKYELGIVNAYYILGFAYDEKQLFDAAASYYFKGLDITREKDGPEFTKKKIYLLQCLGVVYENTFQYESALKYMTDALEIALTTENQESLAELYYNIGTLFRKKGNLDSAMSYHAKSLELSKAIDYKYIKARAYNSMGVIYSKMNEYVLSKECYLKAVDIGTNNRLLSKEMPMFINNLGEDYFLQGDFDKAKSYYTKALNVSISNTDTVNIKCGFNNLGDVYAKEGDFEEAIGFYRKAIALGNFDAVDKELQRAYQNLSHVYEKQGQYQLALEAKSQYITQTDKIVALKDDLSQQNAQYRMKELEWKRQLMAKEVILARVEKENLWGKILLGVALFFIFFSVRLIFIYYRKIARVKKEINSYKVEWMDF